MPAELRTFLQPGSQLVETSESGIAPIQRSLKALKVGPIGKYDSADGVVSK